jgi:arachidonate 15-lipoxygenase
MALATRNHLPADHPIRRLLQPHVYATQSSDQMVTYVQMTRDGDFENTYGLTHDGVCNLFEATSGDFDLRRIDPSVDNDLRGLAGATFETPALDNRLAIMDVIREHVARYLALYYDDDAALARDGAYEAWLAALRRQIPHGVDEIAGTSANITGAVDLIATFIYLATVEHEIVDSGVWNYQLWSDVQPPRVYANGQLQLPDPAHAADGRLLITGPGRAGRDGLPDVPGRPRGLAANHRPRAGRVLAHRAAQPQGQHQRLTIASAISAAARRSPWRS